VSAAAVAAAAALSLGLGSGPAVADPAPAPAPAPADIPVPTTPEQLLEQISRYAPPVSFTNPLQGSGPKQLVTFGDSFTAIAGKNGSRGEEPGQLPWTFNCSTDMDNWPKVAARQANVSLGDWSCNGMGGAPLVQLVAPAPRTSRSCTAGWTPSSGSTPPDWSSVPSPPPRSSTR
jgi:hypothetical protein